MSQSPLEAELDQGSTYLASFAELAERIRKGASFSGRERNCVFLNLGGKSFADASAALELDLLQDSRGIAVCDWDHDGDLDFWMTNRTAPRLQLMQNQNAALANKSVAFLLVGDPAKSCPSDAAGARLVLSAGGIDRTQTVHLGDGFVSQSSRWLHFGLGEAGSFEKLVVHWPAGEPESFDEATVGGRFVLKQGTGKASTVAGVAPSQLEISELELPESSDTTRVWLSEPVQLPSELVIPNLPAGPALLNLWASWCAPCQKELKAFGAAKNLPLVPINIENLDAESEITPQKAAILLRSLAVDQPGGFASKELISALNDAISQRIYRHRNLPLPASFLLDSERRIRAIYKGSVDVATVVADLKKLDDPQLDPFDEAVPFPGRWSKRIFKSHPLAVAAAYLEGGYRDDARNYLKKSLETAGGEAPDAKLRTADILMKLAEIDRAEEQHESAINHYLEAIGANPKLMPAHIFLVLSLADSGRSEEAMAMVAQLKESAPGNPNFLNLEADVHRAAGDDVRAVEGYRGVLAANSRYIPAIDSLASILATSAAENVRDGTEAVKLAEFLAGSPGARDNVQFVTTLADAYAEAGQFEKALAEAERAMKLVLLYGDDETIRRQQLRIDQFRQQCTPSIPPR